MLGNVDTYSYVFDPYLPEVVESQLSDDLASIATDLETGMRHYRAGDVEEALWWWQFSYVSSWGNLAGAALKALLSVVAHDRLDVEFTGEPRIEAASMRCWTAASRCTDRSVESAGTVPVDPGAHPKWALSCRSTAARRSPTPTRIKRVARRIVDTKQGRPRRRRRGLRHGRQHRRAARPRRRR